MKRNLPARYVLSIVAACLLGAFSVAPLSGCAFLAKAKSAFSSPATVVSLESIGAIVDTIMKDASKLKVAGHVTDAQWNTLAADYAKEQTLYHSAVAGVDAAVTPASSTLVASMSSIVADFKAFSQ